MPLPLLRGPATGIGTTTTCSTHADSNKQQRDRSAYFCSASAAAERCRLRGARSGCVRPPNANAAAALLRRVQHRTTASSRSVRFGTADAQNERNNHGGNGNKDAETRSTTSSSSWFDELRRIIAGKSVQAADQSKQDDNDDKQQKLANRSSSNLIDTDSAGDASNAEHSSSRSSSSSIKNNKSTQKKGTNKSTIAAQASTLPTWSKHWSEEFGKRSPSDMRSIRRRQKLESTRRIVKIAAERVLEPSAVALLGMSASLVLGIGAAEAMLLIDPVHLDLTAIVDGIRSSTETTDSSHATYGTTDIAKFVARYSLEQLLPSTVWSTQEGNLIAAAMGYGGGGDAATATSLLRQLDPTVPSDASTLLALGFCQALRSMAAGFMLLAQLVRAGTIGAQAPSVYEERVRSGREPPILLPSSGIGGRKGERWDSTSTIDQPGLIVRFCGRESNIISTSLRRMGHRVFPVFEDPFSNVSYLISQHSESHRIPVFWSVRPDRYGSSKSWDGFPVSQDCLVRTSTGKNILVLEADATNANDPLALGDQALDLTLDDSSQGFRRIEELFSNTLGAKRFRTLKVYLGNTLEVETSGGGHAYTLRHRVKYSKEVDVLIDSRAPILGEILNWCDRVTAGKKNVSGKNIILFQTSSRQYFLSLQLLLKDYGYEVHDPLDWHVLSELSTNDDVQNTQSDSNFSDIKSRSLLGILNADHGQSSKAHSLQDISRLTRLPRLIYYGKTAGTVNAVQALVDAGGVDAANCCALLDKEDGTRFLQSSLADDRIELIQRGDSFLRTHQSKIVEIDAKKKSSLASKKKIAGLNIICSSAIYDDLYRQVRQWTRMGYSASDIQAELDGRYHGMLRQSKAVREVVAEATEIEENKDKNEDSEVSANRSVSASNESSTFGEDLPVEEETKDH